MSEYSEEDVGNIILLEHVNVQVPDQLIATLFYVVGRYSPEDLDLREGAGVGIQRIEDLPGLKITPFVRRAIESCLLPVLGQAVPSPARAQCASTSPEPCSS